MRRVAHEVLPPLAGIAGLIVVWAVIAATTSTTSIPSPLAVSDALVDGLRAGTIQEAALKTLIRLAFSFVVAVVLGTGFRLLIPDWRGALLGWFTLVWIANIYMSLFGRLRLDIKREKVEIGAVEHDVGAVQPRKRA